MSDNEDEIFDIFVEDQNDIRGMIAYCFYRFKKKTHFHEKKLSPEDKAAFRKNCVTGRPYDKIKLEAAEAVTGFADGVVKKHSKEKFWYDIRVGIIAGLISGLLVPLCWHEVKELIVRSGVDQDVPHISAPAKNEGQAKP